MPRATASRYPTEQRCAVTLTLCLWASSIAAPNAAREIWVAARSGGFHFRWDGAAWRNTRDGSELFAALSNLVSQQLGRGLRLLG